MNYHLAQINIAEMKGNNIDDPMMKDFVDNLDYINKIAESSPGFVWRLKDDEDNATAFNPYNEKRIIINFSIWQNIESLENFTFNTVHKEFLIRRKEWFKKMAKAYYALWWIPEGNIPTLEEAISKLELLQKKGASQNVFNFRKKIDPPHG